MQDLENIDKLEIKRSEWLTPDKAKQLKIPSQLLDPTSGLKCCLGFALIACGAKPNDMARNGHPDALRQKYFQKQFIAVNQTIDETQDSEVFARSAIDINDDEEITNEEREEQLTHTFGNHGITLTFID